MASCSSTAASLASGCVEQIQGVAAVATATVFRGYGPIDFGQLTHTLIKLRFIVERYTLCQFFDIFIQHPFSRELAEMLLSYHNLF